MVHKNHEHAEKTDLGHSKLVAALFDARDQAEIALSELERSGVPVNKIGVAFPANGGERNAPPTGAKAGKKEVVVPGLPSSGFPGWTMGMAPWVITGLGPMVVQGSLSLAHRKDRPDDLHSLISALGLREEAETRVQAAFERKAVLVTVEDPEKETISTHILERNGGHTLPRK